MRRPQRRKYHYFYKTICIITGKYYYGIHSTDNIDDGYVGSGKMLGYSINKYGKENHICEKLEFFDTREKLKEKEIEIVNENLLKDPMCMNIGLGGEGGWLNESHKIKNITNFIKAGHLAVNKKRLENPEWWKSVIKKQQQSIKKNLTSRQNILRGLDWTGKKHSEESKEKMRSHKGKQQGEKNSQYGTCWITNGNKNKKINRGDEIPNGWKLGRKY